MSALRPSIDRQHADQCLPVLLRLQGMRRCASPQSRGLLRVLLVRRRALSSDSGGARVGINSQLLCLIAPSDEHLSAAQILSREELVSDLVQRSAMVAGAGAGAGAAMHTLDTVILRRWSIAASIVAFCATGTATASGSAITLLNHCGAYTVRRFDPSRCKMGESVPLRRCRPCSGSGSPSSEDTPQRSGKRTGREGAAIAMNF